MADRKKTLRITGTMAAMAAAVGAFLLLSRRGAAETPPGDSSLFGLVTDAATGLPLPGVMVRLGSLTRTTGSDGRYLFPSVAPGSYPVSFQMAGYQTREGEMITILEGVNELNIQMQAVAVKGTLAGVVTDAATGAPLSGVKVTLGTAVAFTTNWGSYLFLDIPPGSYPISFEKTGYGRQDL